MKRAWLIALMAAAGCLPGCRNDQQVVSPQQPSGEYKLSDFSSAKTCSLCHPQYYLEWSGSMHRYSTSDPIWMLANNSLQASTEGRLGKTCFMCHAPMGFLTGNTKPTFQFSELDPLVREGITCDFCHVLRPPYVTTNQIVRYRLQPGLTKYGPFIDTTGQTAHGSGTDPSYDRSDYCRMCHDLIVNNVPVEITVTEWQNSPWGAMSVECQTCHMPAYTGRAAPGAPVRTNLHRHTFAGVDLPITDFPYKAELRAEIDSLLKNSATLIVDVPSGSRAGDTVRASVCVYNDRTGHNLPTSVFFNRQMWLEVTVWNAGDTVYRSGHLDANGDLMDKNSALRPNEDRDLAMFAGTLYKNGLESNVFELDSLVNNSIKPFECRKASYRFVLPRPGLWSVTIRLLFRPFGPHLFRAVNAGSYTSELPIYEMFVKQTAIDVR